MRQIQSRSPGGEERKETKTSCPRCSIFNYVDCQRASVDYLAEKQTGRSIIRANKSFAFHRALKFDSLRFFCTSSAVFARLPWQTKLLKTIQRKNIDKSIGTNRGRNEATCKSAQSKIILVTVHQFVRSFQLRFICNAVTSVKAQQTRTQTSKIMVKRMPVGFNYATQTRNSKQSALLFHTLRYATVTPL